MTQRLHAAALAAAVLALATACGDTCPTETPAKVDAIGSCSAAPGATVSVPVRLCPTCNQSGATCDVDTSQVASSGYIALDPTVEACDNVTTCPSSAPACQPNPLTCTFTAPSTPGSYTLTVFDPSTNRTINGTLEVASGPSSCAFALTAN